MPRYRQACVLLPFLLASCDSAPVVTPPAVPYTLTAFDDARITSEGGAPNFQTVRAPVDFRDGPFAEAKMIVDLRSTCFPFESWTNNPPPAGQNWPADCDAFDRNFEIELDAPAGIELMRAITPFGGPEHLEIDITDAANGLPGAHMLQTHITTYSDGAGKVSGSKGGWNVTVKLEMTPGDPPRKVLAVLPLFDGSQGATGDPPVAKVTVPAGTVSTRIEYRATGHGGGKGDSACFGPAEEFCTRTHHVMLDGAELQAGLQPARDNCDKLCTRKTYTSPSGATREYCFENPCGAINSVEAPRANWCPGSLTPPFTWTPELAPGPHEVTYKIDNIAAGGTWRLSAILFAFAD